MNADTSWNYDTNLLGGSYIENKDTDAGICLQFVLFTL